MRISALYEIEYNTSVPLLHLLLEFPQMFKPAYSNGIGEIGDALLDQSAIFYLNKTAAPLPTFKQQVNARIDAIAHFGRTLSYPDRLLIVPSSIASLTSRLGTAVLTPTRDVGISISSKVYCRRRAGLLCRERYAGLPGSQHARMLPVLGQWAVTTCPLCSFTSTIKRL